SIGKPLPNRHTLVISRQANYRATGCVVVSTLSHAIALASELGNELYVAGGAEIYTLALPHAHGVFLSEVHQTSAHGATRLPVGCPRQRLYKKTVITSHGNRHYGDNTAAFG
ncbi:dihydrofolate reductase, partial [Escherichia coli]